MNNVKNKLVALGLFNRNSPTQQMIFGCVAGYITGYMTMAMGKKAAFAAGGGIILFQLAQNHGLTKITWDEASDKARELTSKMEERFCSRKKTSKAAEFAKKNACFTASFIGGFLIGVAVR